MSDNKTTIETGNINFSEPVQAFLTEVNNDISKFDEEQLGMYLLDVKNNYYAQFSELVTQALKATPKENRIAFMYELQDTSSVFSADIQKNLL